MSALYGSLVLLGALVALVLTAWTVDRIDARDRGPRRSVWRPWYRTAIASATCFPVGIYFALGSEVLWVAFVVYAALLAAQLWTRAGIGLQALEVLSMSLSLAAGMALIVLVNPPSLDLRGATVLGLLMSGVAWGVAGAVVAAMATRARQAIAGSGEVSSEVEASRAGIEQ